MKNSIVYLPSDKQADLEVLVKEVLKRLYQTVFIIQYGSYARDIMAHVKSKVDLLFSAVSARFFSGENLCNSK